MKCINLLFWREQTVEVAGILATYLSWESAIKYGPCE